MSNIKHFPGASVPAQEPCADIIEMLELALQQAKDGHLVALGLVKVKRQPMAFAQSYHTEPGTSHTFSAGVMSLFQRVAEALNEDSDV